MKFYNDDNKMVVVENLSGEKLHWDVSVYERTHYSTVDDMFRDINAFLSTRPTDQQAQVFNIYKDIRHIFDEVFEPNALTRMLSDKVAELYSIVTYEAVDHWASRFAKVVLPPDLSDHYDPDYSADGTYLRHDYLKLVSLTILLRMMIPMWGEYTKIIKDHAGSVYKEYAAMKLMKKAVNIMMSEPMVKLRNYVQHAVANEQHNNPAIINGMGSAMLPEWLLSIVVVRRLAITEIDASPETGNIITNIYGFMIRTHKDIDRKFGGPVNEKFREDDGEGTDDGVSVAEAYKVKQDVSLGDLAIYEAYASNLDKVAKDVLPSIDLSKVDACMSTVASFDKLRIASFQETLIQWIMNSVIPARSIPRLGRDSLARVLAVTQAVIWDMGFPELAVMVTAVPIESDSSTMVLQEPRLRIPGKLADRLSELYPYWHPQIYTRGEPQAPDRKNNVACKAIKAVAKEVQFSIYQSRSPERLWRESSLYNQSGKFQPPANMAELFASLVIKLAEV